MWPFRWPTHTAASSHLFSLTWHVKTLPKAPQHPPALAHLSLDNTWRTKTHLFAYMCYGTIKPNKAIFDILPILLGTCFSDSSFLFPHPLCCFISLLSSTVTCIYTQWINLLGLDWWPAGLLLTKALPNMVSYWEIMLSCHSIGNGDPLCQSWSLAAVTAVPPSLPLWPDSASGDRAGVTWCDKCIPMSSLLGLFWSILVTSK